MKSNANDLRRQIEEKKQREAMAKKRERDEDLALEMKVKEDLKRMNQRFISEMTNEGTKKPS